MKLSKKLSALPFAHLLGLSAARADDGDDGDAKQGVDESDEDYAKRMEDDKEKKDAAKKAEDDKKDPSAGDDEPDDDEKKGKKAKKAEESGDDDDKEKAARASERARCAAIFACASAGVRPDVAAHMAFSTDMSAAAAIAMLDSMAAGAPARPSNLASRMAAVNAPNVGTDSAAAPAANSSQGVAARIIAAGKKRRGEV